MTPTSTIDTADGALLPGGTVTFFDGTRDLGFGSVDNQGDASAAVADLPAGIRSITADYNGNINYSASTSEVLRQSVNPGGTTTAITASPTSVVFGQPVALSATVSPVAPASGTVTGTVTFSEGGVAFATAPLVNGVAGATRTNSVGSHQYTASYSATDNYGGSTSAPVGVTVTKAATTTSLAASSPTSTVGQAVTFTATVSVSAPGAGTPTGTVQFKDGAAPLGVPVPLAGLTANVDDVNARGGAHSITAVYAGDGNFDGSSSSPLTHTVRCDTTYTGTISGNVNASPGATTCITNARISGGLFVPAGASVAVSGSTFGGGVSVTNGAAVQICGSSFNGLTISGATKSVLVGDPFGSGCAANTSGGNAMLSNNAAGVVFAGNRVTGLLQVNNTSGGATLIAGNTVGSMLSCAGNNPAPTSGGRPNNVTGARLGQCAGAFQARPNVPMSAHESPREGRLVRIRVPALPLRAAGGGAAAAADVAAAGALHLVAARVAERRVEPWRRRRGRDGRAAAAGCARWPMRWAWPPLRHRAAWAACAPRRVRMPISLRSSSGM